MITVSRIRLALYGMGALSIEQKKQLNKADKNRLNQLHKEMQDEINDLKKARFNFYFNQLANKVEGWQTTKHTTQTNIAGFLRMCPMEKGDKCTARLDALNLTQRDLDQYLNLKGFQSTYKFNLTMNNNGKNIKC